MEKTMGTKWYVRRCAIGTGVSLGIYALTLALCAFLTARGIVGEGLAEKCVWLCAALAVFSGAALCGNRTVKRGAMMLLCGVCFYLTALLCGFLFGGALVPARVLRFALPSAAGTLGAYLFAGGKKKGKRKKHSRRARR